MEQESALVSRMQDELKDLEVKLEKLQSFINTKMDEAVTDEYQKYLLRLQLQNMMRYYNVLFCRESRMNGFPDAHVNLMTFGDAVEVLRAGGAVKRVEWKDIEFVVKQVPSIIHSEIIPKMTSLPQTAKNLLLNDLNGYISYNNQLLAVRPSGSADSWTPTPADVFAMDWVIVVPCK